jgi:site-specific recombinase XerD
VTEICWERYPLIAKHLHVRKWLLIQQNLGLAQNTVEAYGRALEDYLRFCQEQDVVLESATLLHVSEYVRDLSTRPILTKGRRQTFAGLSNATIQQRLTAIRLFYDYLVEEGIRPNSPIRRGYFTSSKGFGGNRARGLVPRYEKLPWIPSDDQWHAILETTQEESRRNKFMFALAYDAGLRREELCALETGDLDPAHRLVNIRAETTKNRRARILPYSETTQCLYVGYLQHRRQLSRERGGLFLSESHRNQGCPLSIWTWSKVVKGIADRAYLPQLTTHTLRHLCLTDLARAGWDIHEIATFAGHRSIQTTLRYIHLSGRELATKMEQSMNSIHAWRIRMMQEVLG